LDDARAGVAFEAHQEVDIGLGIAGAAPARTVKDDRERLPASVDGWTAYPPIHHGGEWA